MFSCDVVSFGEPLQLNERQTPQPSGSEIILRVLAAGVCHTDLHVWEGYYDLGGGRRMNFADRGLEPPVTLGHEIVGEVVAVGPEAKGVSPGEVRLIYPWIGCGECAGCVRGNEHLCASARYLGIFRPGGYADHVLVPHPRYLIEIGDIPPAQAAPLACSGLTTYSALTRAGLETLRESPIVIIGAGGLGLMSLSILSALGGRGAVVVDISPANRAAALEAGALAAVDARADDAARQVLEHCGGAVPVVIDFVGAPATVELGLGLLAKGGQLTLVGLFGGELSIALPLMPLRSTSIVGSFVGSLPALRDLVALVRTGKVRPLPISECALEDANDALLTLKRGGQVGRIVLRPKHGACACG
ncbi:alcohol dehydrogenase [Bosea sp. (in: a-proteobacteria)]|uniref:alcohol dehydrogenase n=1 Tax=Bosea sp. (in: a-proteobacteria) TaxID=1871050 RepID=UPI002FC81280